jgi:HK97 family phage major capsid protein
MSDKKEIKPEEIKEAVDALRTTVEKYGTDSAETKEMAEKTNEIIEKQEKQNAEIVKKQLEAEKKALDLEDRFKDLELELAKASTAQGKDFRENPEYKALNLYAKKGILALSPGEIKVMRMDDGTSGGYLTTTEMDNIIIKELTEISPVRQVARVKTTSKKTLEIARRTSIPVATYEGETADGGDSQSGYANEQLTAYRLTNTIGYTLDQAMDSEFDLMSEINSDNLEAFAYGEGRNFVLGDGVKKPEGFLANASVIAGAFLTAQASVIKGDDILLLTGQLKVGYNPMFAMNRQTLATLRTLKGEDDHYLWQNGLAPSAPNTLAGDPYILMQDMPSIADNALPVIYADFLRGYTITDRTGMSMVRDEVTRKKAAIIEVTFHKWNTGQVVLPEAFKALKITAT